VILTKLYDSISTATVQNYMLREKLVLLLGEEFINRDKSDLSYLLRMVWLSRSTAEFELASDFIKVNLDEVLTRIK